MVTVVGTPPTSLGQACSKLCDDDTDNDDASFSPCTICNHGMCLVLQPLYKLVAWTRISHLSLTSQQRVLTCMCFVATQPACDPSTKEKSEFVRVYMCAGTGSANRSFWSTPNMSHATHGMSASVRPASSLGRLNAQQQPGSTAAASSAASSSEALRSQLRGQHRSAVLPRAGLSHLQHVSLKFAHVLRTHLRFV